MEMQGLQGSQANQTNEDPQNPQCTIYENFQATGLQGSQVNQTNEDPQNLQPNVYENFQVTGSRRSQNSGQETASNVNEECARSQRQEVALNGKMSRVKTVLLVICLIVTIASASATITLFIKVMNNEKLIEKSLNQFNTLSANCKETSFQEKVDRSLKEVEACLNEIRDNSNSKFQTMTRKVDMKLSKVGSRLYDVIDNSTSMLRRAQEKVDMKLNELGTRLNDTTNSTIHEFQVMKEKVDMKLNEVGSGLNDSLENSISKLLSVEEQVDLKLNEIYAHLNDTKNETLHELRGLEEKVRMKLSEVSARLNDTDDSMSKLGRLLPVENCTQTSKNGVNPLTSGGWVYCSNGWTVFQKRMDGSIPDFHNKTWEHHSQGFGNLNGEFWLGLRKLHEITRQGGCRLRVELQSFDNDTAYAEYRTFSIGNESDLFRLQISGYSGTAGDSFMYSGSNKNNNMAFTTVDRDNDRRTGGNCAANGSGSWWYNDCGAARLNGGQKENLGTCTNLNWYTWKNSCILLKSSMMMIRCD